MATRDKLSKRHKQTKEVGDILTGEGFKKVKPKYTSKPDIQGAERSHQVLCHEFDVLTEHKKLYGKAANMRHLDPGMNEILAWGADDEPVKSDFINGKNAFQEKYKINKMGVNFISEK